MFSDPYVMLVGMQMQQDRGSVTRTPRMPPEDERRPTVRRPGRRARRVPRLRFGWRRPAWR